MRQEKKAIGILGGMGPEASVYMYKTLIEFSIKYFGAKDNQDFPEIVLDSVPVPDFISSDKYRIEAKKMLIKRVKRFNQKDFLCLSIACNTAHILFDDLQKISKVPFVSMIEEVAKSVSKTNAKKVGIIATPSTIKFKLYQRAFEKRSIESIIPTDVQIKSLNKIIRNVIAGKIFKSDTKKLFVIANSLKRDGAESIILGCTEIPLVFTKSFSLPVLNSVEILSMALLRKYYKFNTIRKKL